jgi:hypothetical protein
MIQTRHSSVILNIQLLNLMKLDSWPFELKVKHHVLICVIFVLNDKIQIVP